MVRLSVNVNKVAVLRNSRGGNEPRLIQVVEDLIQFGAWGITVHPRPDGRHILYRDVRDIAQCVQKYSSVEFNVEGYPSEEFLDLIKETKPHQCTLVPDPPEALTSDQGWDLENEFSFLEKVLSFLKDNKIRSSIFIDPLSFSLDFLRKLQPDRVEFYTGSWAYAFDCISQRGTSLLGDKAISSRKNVTPEGAISNISEKEGIQHSEEDVKCEDNVAAQRSRLASHHFASAKAGTMNVTPEQKNVTSTQKNVTPKKKNITPEQKNVTPTSYVIPAKAGIQNTVPQNKTNGDIALNEECLKILKTYRIASEKIHKMGIGINAGHDLNQRNLKALLKAAPLIQEVSIGHAFISEALYDGLKLTLDNYHLILHGVSS